MENFKLTSSPLPYTMGNSGDLIKHGILAEFTDWHAKEIKEDLIFYDPFGGRPWQNPIHELVAKRICNLASCPLRKIQSKNRNQYIGSGHIVEEISKENGNKIKVFSSDKDSKARHDLIATGLSPISTKGFNPEDAYSILSSNIEKEQNNLILIDPFYDLEKINKTIFNKIIQLITTSHTSVALYVLYSDQEIKQWEIFQEKHKKLTPNNVNFVALKCKAIDNSAINGESKFHSYIVLYTHKYYSTEETSKFSKRIYSYAKNLEKALGNPIEYYSQTAT